MRFHFLDIMHRVEPVEVETSVESSPLFANNKAVLSSTPIVAKLKLWPEAGMVVVRGSLTNEVSYTCSRCLESFSESYDIPFDESFFQAVNEPDDDLDHVNAVKEDQIDLTPWLEESFLLALPFIPICKPDCLGLCSECGSNRNLSRCRCSNTRIDPRLMGLADWIDQHPEDQS